MALSNWGTTPSSLFLRRLEAAARTGDWRQVARTVSDIHNAYSRTSYSVDRGLQPAHVRVAVAAVARVVRNAAAAKQEEQQQQEEEEEQQKQKQKQQQRDEDAPQQEQQRQRRARATRVPLRSAWWDFRLCPRPVETLWPRDGGERPGGLRRRPPRFEAGGAAPDREWDAGNDGSPRAPAEQLLLFARVCHQLLVQGRRRADAVAAVAMLTALADMGFALEAGAPRSKEWSLLRGVSGALLEGVLDAVADGAAAGPPGSTAPDVSPQAARLLLSAQLAAVRLQDRWPPAPPRSDLLGRAAAALGPRDGVALFAAWRARGGELAPGDAELLCRTLEGGEAAAGAVGPHRAVAEVELLAALPVQPPPQRYLSSLLAALAAPAADGRPAALQLASVRQLDLLTVLAGRPQWAALSPPWHPLVAALLARALDGGTPTAREVSRLLPALRHLVESGGYPLSAEFVDSLGAGVAATAKRLNLAQLSVVCSSLAALGVVLPAATAQLLGSAAQPALASARPDQVKAFCELASSLPALGWSPALAGDDLAYAALSRGLTLLREGAMPSRSVVQWLRALRHLTGSGTVPRGKTGLLLAGLAAAFTDAAEPAAAAARRSAGDVGKPGQGERSPRRASRGTGPDSGWPWWDVVDALAAVEELGVDLTAAVEYWDAVRPLVGVRWQRMPPEALARLVMVMGRCGHRANRPLLDGVLLPALEPALQAVVAEAQQQQGAEALLLLLQQQQQMQMQQQMQKQMQQQMQQQTQQQGAKSPWRQQGAGLPQQQQQQQQQQQPVQAGLLAQLLPAMAAGRIVPRAEWWQLYAAALAAVLPQLDVAALAAVLAATDVLGLPVFPAWADLVWGALPPERARRLSPVQAAELLAGLAHLADAAPGGDGPDPATAALLWSRAVTGVSAAGGSGAPSGLGRGTEQQHVCGPDGNTPPAVASMLLRCAGRLHRANPALGPPATLLPPLLAASASEMGALWVAPEELGQVALAADALGLRADDGGVARWAAGLQSSLEMQLGVTRLRDAGRVVVGLCAVGVRPAPPLLDYLLAMGPDPQFTPELMARLQAALTALIDEESGEGGGRDGAGGGSAPWGAALDPPAAGAAPTDFDSFVDAARAHLGAAGSQLGALPPEGPIPGHRGTALDATAARLWEMAEGRGGTE